MTTDAELKEITFCMQHNADIIHVKADHTTH